VQTQPCPAPPLALLIFLIIFKTGNSSCVCFAVLFQGERCPLASPGQSQFRKISRKTPTLFVVLGLSFGGNCLLRAPFVLPAELYGCESGQWAVSVELKAMRVVPGQGEDGLEMPSG